MDVSFRYLGQLFVWDERKAAENLKKHKISFDRACEVFFDPFVVLLDASPEDEARDAALGLMEDWTLLYVVHAIREKDSIRMISARRATAAERRYYENY